MPSRAPVPGIVDRAQVAPRRRTRWPGRGEAERRLKGGQRDLADGGEQVGQRRGRARVHHPRSPHERLVDRRAAPSARTPSGSRRAPGRRGRRPRPGCGRPGTGPGCWRRSRRRRSGAPRPAMVAMNTRTNSSVAATNASPGSACQAREAAPAGSSARGRSRVSSAPTVWMRRAQRLAVCSSARRCAAARGRRPRAGRWPASPGRCPRRRRRGWGDRGRGGAGPRCAARSRSPARSRRRVRICAGCCSNWIANTRSAPGPRVGGDARGGPSARSRRRRRAAAVTGARAAGAAATRERGRGDDQRRRGRVVAVTHGASLTGGPAGERAR